MKADINYSKLFAKLTDSANSKANSMTSNRKETLRIAIEIYGKWAEKFASQYEEMFAKCDKTSEQAGGPNIMMLTIPQTTSKKDVIISDDKLKKIIVDNWYSCILRAGTPLNAPSPTRNVRRRVWQAMVDSHYTTAQTAQAIEKGYTLINNITKANN